MPKLRKNIVNGGLNPDSSASDKELSDFENITEAFVLLAKELSKQKCFEDVTRTLLERDTLREQVVQAQQEVETYKVQLEDSSKKHNSSYSELLATHRAEVAAKDESITGLKDQISKLEEQLTEEQKLKRDETKKNDVLRLEVDQMRQHIGERDETIARIGEAKNKMGDEMTKQGKELEETKKRLKNERKSRSEAEEARKALQIIEKEYNSIKSYAVEIHHEQPRSEEFKGICDQILATVMKHFQNDVSDKILETPRAWSNFSRIIDLEKSPPIPPSNQPAAKFIRGAVALSSFSELLSHYIFQPAPLDIGDIRKCLNNEARDHPSNEAFCRSLILAFSYNNAVELNRENVKEVIEHIQDIAECLFPPPKVQDLANDLKPLVESVVDCWNHMRRYVTRIESDMNLDSDSSWKWETVSCSPDKPKKQERDSDEKVLVLVPRVYTISKEGYQSLFPGVVLRKWQLAPVLRLWENMQASGNSKAKTVDGKPTEKRRLSASANSWKNIWG